LVAPSTGASVAYWSLLVVAGMVNFCSDKYWSFSPNPSRRPRPMARPPRVGRLLALTAAMLLSGLLVVAFTNAFILVVSVFMIVVAATTLTFQLYKWWRPEHNDPHRYGEPDAPCLPGVILVPMRHEEAVAGQTLERLARLDHPDYWVVPIVDHPDDPGTAAIAHAKARQHPGKVLVCPYPEETGVHNKPIGLNAAVELLHELQIPFAWVGVADAEDLFHPDLLKLVDYRFRTTGAGIVQCGVQLMNFASDPRSLPLPSGRLARARRWWKAHASAWWRVANVLEYFKWFQSRLKLQAAVRVMPLGGNTVFFRREFLEALHRRYGRYWDEECLTEDCKIGILASVLGFKVDVVYVEELVTREETPATLAGFVRQRVRWMQGFIHVFAEGDWLRLPTLSQRVLAIYVLGFQFFQAVAGLLAPVALALAIVHKAPVLLTLVATVPLALGLLNVLLDVVLLAQFGQTFGARVRLRDYAGLVLGAYPFQVVLSVAAVWATARFVIGRNNWVKTRHHGVHLGMAANSVQPAPAGKAT
jgi:cellulose synthase/poly-beta-1,6-N-acetylglucosamine synthase-like glycosyltransferase